MFEILRNRRIIIALFVGLALVFYIALFYLDLWQPRKYKEQDGKKKYDTRYLTTLQGLPWSIRITLLLLFVYMVIYSVYGILEPKSW